MTYTNPLAEQHFGSSVELPDRFTLVVCDGPAFPVANRYGLAPVLGPRIAPEGLIIIDDAHEMVPIIEQWLSMMPLEIVSQTERVIVLQKGGDSP